MSDNDKNQDEMSMEEIISSIRKIVSDGTENPPKSAEKAPKKAKLSAVPSPVPEPELMLEDRIDDAVFDLTEILGGAESSARQDDVLSFGIEEKAAKPFIPVEDNIPVATTRQPPKRPALLDDEVMITSKGVEMAAPSAETLLSDEAVRRTSAALDNLRQIKEKTAAHESHLSHLGEKTIEQFVFDLMRPMLKEWMEKNLPGLVEKMVSKEIERLTRTGGDD